MAPHAFPELLRHRGDDFAGKAPRARKALFKNIVLVEQLQPEMGVLRRQADIVDNRRRREMLRRVHASSRQRNTGVDNELPIDRNRVAWGKSVAVRVAHGGRRISNKKNKKKN